MKFTNWKVQQARAKVVCAQLRLAEQHQTIKALIAKGESVDEAARLAELTECCLAGMLAYLRYLERSIQQPLPQEKPSPQKQEHAQQAPSFLRSRAAPSKGS